MVYAAVDKTQAWHPASQIDYSDISCSDICNDANILSGGTISGDLAVSGKIRSSPTMETDSQDTVATKSYVDVTYSNCGWRDGSMCNDGELAQGFTSTQVKCCSETGITCTPTSWTTYSTTCNAGSCGECGYTHGNYISHQSRILADCQKEYRDVTGSVCSNYCGRCSPSYTCQNHICVIWEGGR